MSQKLSNKKAVVTGGGSGIGQAISERFAAEGAHVYILDFDEKNGAAVAEAINAKGQQATFIKTDVSNHQSVQAIFDEVAGESGIDCLVNNAGIAAVGNVEQCSEEELDRVYNVNVKGIYNCLLAAAKHMKAKGGAVVNMASVASTIGIPDRFAYSMSKGAALTMTYSFATDYVEYGIRCNCIAPGRVHTPFVDGFIAKNYPGQEKEMFEKLSATQPVGRMGKPEEIAGLALYLCSDEASFITGSNFPIDGGFVTVKK